MVFFGQALVGYVFDICLYVNQPDLVLFVGEALVGNEAVDQLTKFNQALADHSNMTQPRLIDGIILTKFDTIDDKVCLFLCNFSIF
jgi:signal recognition particle GTPase